MKWWRSGLAGVLGAGIVIVVFRALVYLLFEQLAFDSDQAIVGLMAKASDPGQCVSALLLRSNLHAGGRIVGCRSVLPDRRSNRRRAAYVDARVEHRLRLSL